MTNDVKIDKIRAMNTKIYNFLFIGVIVSALLFLGTANVSKSVKQDTNTDVTYEIMLEAEEEIEEMEEDKFLIFDDVISLKRQETFSVFVFCSKALNALDLEGIYKPPIFI